MYVNIKVTNFQKLESGTLTGQGGAEELGDYFVLITSMKFYFC